MERSPLSHSSPPVKTFCVCATEKQSLYFAHRYLLNWGNNVFRYFTNLHRIEVAFSFISIGL